MRRLILGVGVCALLATAAHAGPELEHGVLAEINFVRAHPHEYAEQLREGDMTPTTREAIAWLETREPAPPLRPEPGLGVSAAGHAADQGENDSFEHTGSDGTAPYQRMQRQGVWAGMLAEEMAAGETTPADVVRALIVDEGVPDRGHRKDLLDPALRRAGVGCAPHPTYRVICVVDLASSAPGEYSTAAR
jgi:uncharacterized protein YkwD